MAIEGLIVMSQQELQRQKVMEKLLAKEIKQHEAGKILKLSRRQIIRLLQKYRRDGVTGLVSKKREKASNNRIREDIQGKVLEIIRKKYIDFGPTFLGEKLLENHGIRISKETLRKWMIAEDIWVTKRRKKARIHQQRARRSCFGELIQIDGSPHDWFEGRREKCCLLVFVDDATSRLVNLRFEEKETTAGYFRAMKEYVQKLGLPAALYSDRHSIFRVNMPESKHEGITQFERAMKELGIETICANSPEAKGRVERANGILQDRLVKEMRLRGICDIATANAYLPEFIESYNRKFSVEPANTADGHVQLRGNENLELIFSIQEIRTLSKNLEFSYNNIVYQIKTEGYGYGLRHARVTVCEGLNGKITLLYKGKSLEYTSYKKQKRTTEIVVAKDLERKIDFIVKKKAHKPSVNHPWRQYQAGLAAITAI